MARPSKYTEKLAETICEEIANSTKGLHKIAKNQGVSVSMIMRWLNEHQPFREQYARAREIQADLLAAQIVEIADKQRVGKKIKTTKEGGAIVGEEVTTGDMTERSRLMIDARKWLAGKLAPKKFGDKLDLTTDGEKIPALPCVINWNQPAEENDPALLSDKKAD